MSSPVMGEPSSQTASAAILYVTVNGPVPPSVPSPDSFGSPSRTGDGTKVPFSFSSMSRGSTCSSTAQCIQEEFAHCVIAFRQSGHCSAPRISVPPFFSPPLLLLLPPLPPEEAALLDFLSLPHAAASSPTQKTSARSLMPRRCRVTKMDLLVGLYVRPF